MPLWKKLRLIEVQGKLSCFLSPSGPEDFHLNTEGSTSSSALEVNVIRDVTVRESSMIEITDDKAQTSPPEEAKVRFQQSATGTRFC